MHHGTLTRDGSWPIKSQLTKTWYDKHKLLTRLYWLAWSHPSRGLCELCMWPRRTTHLTLKATWSGSWESLLASGLDTTWCGWDIPQHPGLIDVDASNGVQLSVTSSSSRRTKDKICDRFCKNDSYFTNLYMDEKGHTTSFHLVYFCPVRHVAFLRYLTVSLYPSHKK